jgi:rhodanese-related sulfurtransferase
MALKSLKSISNKKIDFKPLNFSVFQEAWNLFLFSTAFGILFNLFYSNGIELKYVPPKSLHLQEILKSPQSQPAYTGWNTPASSPHIQSPSVQPAPAQDTLPRLSLSGAKDRFDRKSSIFLDARSPDEYKEGHIPGALSFYADQFDEIAPQILPQLTDKTKEIIAYCHGSSCDLSIHLAQKLIEQGYTNVKVFFGGWPEWKKAGYPINTGSNP